MRRNLQNLPLYRSPRLLCEVIKSKNVICRPNYNVINSYLPFSFFHFSMTTLLKLGVYSNLRKIFDHFVNKETCLFVYLYCNIMRHSHGWMVIKILFTPFI